ncbi:MAG: type II toxin-antitoxin system RelE/ParE family toxin [Candidatus Brocadiaceae bacterium]|nr:type II toxin-antitoxin system RelE/ParE family toxin [Candidatus Brocadiaceae bacterium]
MVIHKLAFSNQGKKHLQSLDKTTGQRIFDKLKWLIENVDSVEHLQLKGKYSGLYKLKVGAYRVVYEIDHEKKIITVHKVGHRRDIYK